MDGKSGAGETTLPVVGTRAFQVRITFWVGITMSEALAEVGSMQTVTVSVPPLPPYPEGWTTALMMSFSTANM